MERPIDWNSYINETPYEAFRKSSDYRRFCRLSESLQRVCGLYCGDLRYRNLPKQVIQEATHPVAIAKGHPPYCFRFQCLTTGRLSKFIKEAEYHQFGISNQDAQSGTTFHAAKEVVDRMKPIRDQLLDQLSNLRDKAFGLRVSWWSRYTEYLQSEEWSHIRNKVLERDNHACVLTGSNRQLQVHHLHYKNVGREMISDLVTLHETVHEAIHDSTHDDHAKYRGMLDSLVRGDVSSSPCPSEPLRRQRAASRD